VRELVAAVVVHPAGRDEPRIEVTGRLAQLSEAPELFPQQDIAARRALVAGSGSNRRPTDYDWRPVPQTPISRITCPVLGA
jgi:hypothetical protein